MKIVVVATSGPTTWMVVNALSLKYNEVNVIIENPVSKLKLLRNRIYKQGLINVFGQFLFLIYLFCLRLLSGFDVAKIISGTGLSAVLTEDVNISKVESINSYECEFVLKSLNPDLVIVNGTRIISGNILNACDALFLNIHCGITPAYRGVHGAYWALASGDMANVGVTVHAVDVGVDTGDIIYQAPISIDLSDNFLTYPIKQYIAAIPLLLRSIDDFKNNSLKTYKRNDLNSNIWFHPTLWFYVWNRITKGVR